MTFISGLQYFCVVNKKAQGIRVVLNPMAYGAILVGCSPGSQPAQNCYGSPAVVVVAYHKPFEHLKRLAFYHNNQTTRSTYARASTASGTTKN